MLEFLSPFFVTSRQMYLTQATPKYTHNKSLYDILQYYVQMLSILWFIFPPVFYTLYD